MKFLLFFYFFIFGTFAYCNSTIYKKIGKVPESIIVFDKGYSDIRIDYDLDKKIDFWSVKNASIQIDIYYKNDEIDKKFVRRIFSNYVLEYFYKMDKKKLALRWAKRRPLLSMNISRSSNKFCDTKITDIEKQIKQLHEAINEDVLFAAVENLIDPSCKNSLSKESYRKLEEILFSTLSPGQNPLNTCFSDNRFINSFANSESGKLEAKILSSRFELLRLQLSVNSENHKPTISCSSAANNKSASAKTLENNKMTLFTPLSDDKLSDILTHEFLHMSEVASEHDVENILGLCEKIKDPTYVVEITKDRLPPILSGNASAASEALAKKETANVSSISAENINSNKTTPLNSEDGVLKVASQDLSAAIPAEMTVEQSGIPSVAALSTGLNTPYPMTDAGAEAALRASKALSRPLIETANTFLGAMSGRAFATPTLVSNSQAVNTNGLATGERIVQQITLDGDDNSKPKNALNTQTPPSQNSKLDSLTEKGLPSQSQANLNTNAEALVANAPSGSRSPASIGGKESSWNTSPPTGGRAPTNTRRSAASSPSPEEVITFISRVDYAIAKEKLKDSSFTQQLASQGITILDLNGNTYGAKKGTVIFLDEGNRFVRQK